MVIDGGIGMALKHIAGTTYLKKPEGVSQTETTELRDRVGTIIHEVARDGDAALKRFSRQFDAVELTSVEVMPEEIEAARRTCDTQLLEDMKFGIARVTQFAEAQLKTLTELEIETIPGLHLGHRLIPISRVGCYVPGGRYPLLSSAQMTVIPAKIAGVKEVIVCTPPNVHPAVLYGAHLSGATRIFRVGGAQAIAAMAYGTESIPQVDKIVGPGNKFVNEAKRQVFGMVGIDQLAGPSEIGILADETADPKVLAADLLGQAEHDTEARAILMTTSGKIGERTIAEVLRQIPLLATREVVDAAWRRHGSVVLCDSEQSLIAYSDYLAAEHLQIHTAKAAELAKKLTNYGSLFIGAGASVVFSDKIAGTNHTLPTRAAARYTGGLWVGSFIKTVTHQWVEQKAIEVIAPICVRQSKRESLDAHRVAAEIRINYNVI
jgi:sulfopropanediol 3-dehydrogenase